MNDYQVELIISAECDSDARELINDYTGQETDVEIISVKKTKRR